MPSMFPGYFIAVRKPCKGLLLYGPPGTGKTMMAKALSNEIKATFFDVTPSTLTSKYFGESEKKVKELFQKARKSSSSVIFIDEIESLCSHRGLEGEQEGSSKIKTEILTELDGFSSQNENVFVLAATNLPWLVDTAMLRRLQRRIYVPLPSEPEIESMLRHHLSGIQIEPNFDFKKLAGDLKGYSGAEVETIARDASYMPMRRVVKGLDIEELQKLKEDDLEEPVSIKDFEIAINRNPRTISEHDVQQFTKWSRASDV